MNTLACSSCFTKQAFLACSLCESRAYCSETCASFDTIDKHVHAEHDMDMIMPRIYIGSIEAVKHLPNKIGAVLSVLSSVSKEYLLPLVGKRHFLYIDLDDAKDAPIELYLDQMADFIHKHADLHQENVLVHCHAGMSRSVAAVIYYMMKYKGYATEKQALKEIRKYRPVAMPNKGFMKKLKERRKGL